MGGEWDEAGAGCINLLKWAYGYLLTKKMILDDISWKRKKVHWLPDAVNRKVRRSIDSVAHGSVAVLKTSLLIYLPFGLRESFINIHANQLSYNRFLAFITH